MGWVTTLTDTSQFRAGLGLGAVAALLVAAVATARRRRGRVPIAGTAYAAAALAGLAVEGTVRLRLAPNGWGLVALAAAAAGGAVAQRLADPVLTMLLLLPAGAATLEALSDTSPQWIAPAAALTAVIGGALAADFDLVQRRRTLGPLLLAGTAFGIYGVIPDTESARVLVGAALPFMLLALVCPSVALGSAGAASTVVLWVLVVARDGAARPGSVIGGLGALGLYVAEPLGRRALESFRRAEPPEAMRDRWVAIAVALVLHGTLVVWATRVAGLRHKPVEAVVLLAPVAVTGTVVAGLLLAPVKSEIRRHAPAARGSRPRR